ncbi:MAG: PilZ domain-containing protein [Spirochaetota bacterium]
MAILAPLALLVAVLGILTLALLLRGGKKTSWIEFMIKAGQGGFSLMESSRLREAATVANLADFANIFWSTKDLDRVITAITGVGGEKSREISRLLEKLFALRKRLEFERPRYLMGIRSSRQIAHGQKLRLLVVGLGVFDATLVDNNARYLVLSWPLGMRLPKGFVWKGKKVSIYFYRREDAGYVFDSYVLDDLRIKDVPVIHVGHSESLLRTQKRKSIRAKASMPAYLYLLKRIEGAFEKAELEPGLRSRLVDVSEEGFALVIGGKARDGLQVKVQFHIGERQIVMSGTVKSVDFDRDRNQSTIHVQALSPSPRTRNAIRSFVYGSKAGHGADHGEAEQ